MKKIKKEYEEIYNQICTNEKYAVLNATHHHGATRLEHINKVGYLSFLISKLFRMDTKTITRGALLHDFYTDEDMKDYSVHIHHKIHPQIALKNSLQYFELNEKEKNIIESHMYPFTNVKPKYKESVVVGFSDKIVAVGEFFRYQLNVYVCFAFLFASSFIR